MLKMRRPRDLRTSYVSAKDAAAGLRSYAAFILQKAKGQKDLRVKWRLETRFWCDSWREGK